MIGEEFFGQIPAGFLTSRSRVVVKFKTKYSEGAVYEVDDVLHLIVDGSSQSAIVPGSVDLQSQYLKEVFQVVKSAAKNSDTTVVHLGVGGGSLAKAVLKLLPNVRQVGVDIDGELIEIARQHLELPRGKEFKVRIGDALLELKNMRDEFADVVFRDVFLGNNTPLHLIDDSFYNEVKRVLKPGGVFVANIIDSKRSRKIVNAQISTARKIFNTEPRIWVDNDKNDVVNFLLCVTK
ncbi:hypothetical protein FACS1894125_2210 [Actinomycetota bacterium]|nr:hypothetical protein FACS1894125_2210 [Actinomycetota bacterium]